MNLQKDNNDTLFQNLIIRLLILAVLLNIAISFQNQRRLEIKVVEIETSKKGVYLQVSIMPDNTLTGKLIVPEQQLEVKE